jgi:putative protein kinase ArgK-like GTPase of G3E family
VLLVSASRGQGIEALVEALEVRAASVAGDAPARRLRQARAWLEAELRAEAGRRAVARLGDRLAVASPTPFASHSALVAALDRS